MPKAKMVMFYSLLALLVSLLVDRRTIPFKTERNKDLEILVLRHQLRLLQRQVNKTPRLSRPEKLILAVLAAKFKRAVQSVRSRLNEGLLLFKPDTILKWHRELVKGKWTFKRGPGAGRPRTSAEVAALVRRLARENPRWGADRIQGELGKLGIALGATTVRANLARHGLPPAPQRTKQGSSWHQLLAHYKDQILACDFFTVETARLHTLYVLFFIAIGTRRVHLAGCTRHPTSAWVSQQARQLLWALDDTQAVQRFLIHDHDTKFTRAFDAVFASEGIETLLTPFQAPNANAFAR